MKIKQLMTSNVIYAHMYDSIGIAVEKMKKHNIGFLVILDENEKLCGVVTDRDLLLSLTHESLDSSLDKVMKKEIITAKSNMDSVEAAELLGYYQIRRLVILDDLNNLAGVLTLRDLALDINTEELALEALCEISFGSAYNPFILECDKKITEA